MHLRAATEQGSRSSTSKLVQSCLTCPKRTAFPYNYVRLSSRKLQTNYQPLNCRGHKDILEVCFSKEALEQGAESNVSLVAVSSVGQRYFVSIVYGQVTRSCQLMH